MTDKPEEKDESFNIISDKEKLLKDSLARVEVDRVKSEVNHALCLNLITFYEAEIKKEQDKNAR